MTFYYHIIKLNIIFDILRRSTNVTVGMIVGLYECSAHDKDLWPRATPHGG
jgi:hypothetical protein